MAVWPAVVHICGLNEHVAHVERLCFVVNCLLQDFLRGLISKIWITMTLMTFWIAQQTHQQFNKKNKKIVSHIFILLYYTFKGWVQVKGERITEACLRDFTFFFISRPWVFVCLLWWTNDLSWEFSASLPVTAGIRLGVRIGIICLLLRCGFKWQLIRNWRRAHELQGSLRFQCK